MRVKTACAEKRGSVGMKYKTLFRVGLKFLGVYLLVMAAVSSITYVIQVVAGMFLEQRTYPSIMYMVLYSTGGLIQLGLGLYLFFGGKWIADKAIPGNRPYCHECGYDVSQAEGRVCSECGTEFSNELLERIAAMPPRPERKVL
jgi:hypothetical protein